VSRRRLAYDPALDGIRAVAVLAVLAFHQGGFGWAQGGFLGVSVFFTLSGFLITTLLVSEQAGTGGIAVGSFWVRRLRRLMPAALAGLALAIVLVAVMLPEAAGTLRGDVLAALADVANWRFLLSGHSYADLFAAPSPVQHYWSLAIEEQFYLLYPIVVWLVLVRWRRSRRALAVLLGAGFVASMMVAVVAGAAHPDLVYYATFTRAAELLAGGLLALAVLHRRTDPAPPAPWAMVVGPLALAAMVAVMVTTPESAGWLARGGLAAFSLLSVALIASARRPGPLRRVLSTRPLVALGLVSYGVYVYHWPLFLWLTPDRVGLDGGALFVVRVAVTLGLAAVSYRWLEQPVRRGGALRGRWAALAPPLAMASVTVAVLAVSAGGVTTSDAFAGSRAAVVTLPPPSTPTVPPPVPVAPSVASRVTSSGDSPAIRRTTTTPATTVPVRPVRVVVFGDSTAKADATGLIAWGRDTGRAVVSDVGTIAGCGVVRAVERRIGADVQTIGEGCNQWPTWWPQVLAANPADVAVLVTGPWELADHRRAGGPWETIDEPSYQRYVHDELAAATDVLLAHVRVVVWLTNPPVNPGWGTNPTAKVVGVPGRMERLNAIITSVAAARPRVALVDLAGHVAAIPGALEDHALRPDGVHFDATSSRAMATWLAPAIVAVTR
jgi:peptidoglycan/LPS O-acetylase OafA/YrhL/lysophospholipase L1-like esterase